MFAYPLYKPRYINVVQATIFLPRSCYISVTHLLKANSQLSPHLFINLEQEPGFICSRISCRTKVVSYTEFSNGGASLSPGIIPNANELRNIQQWHFDLFLFSEETKGDERSQSNDLLLFLPAKLPSHSVSINSFPQKKTRQQTIPEDGYCGLERCTSISFLRKLLNQAVQTFGSRVWDAVPPSTPVFREVAMYIEKLEACHLRLFPWKPGPLSGPNAPAISYWAVNPAG